MSRSSRHVAVSLMLLSLAASALAGKPGGGGKAPPPSPPNPFAIYEWRPDLGGWLDKQRNLVWGYSFVNMRGTSTHSGYGITHQKATTEAANYASALFDMAASSLPQAAAETEAFADWQTAQGDIDWEAGNYERADRWYAKADANYAKGQADRDSIQPFFAASLVAGQYQWRLPTQAEAQLALSNGLFTYVAGGFNGYDGSPYVGVQVPWNNLTWSSTLSKKKTEAWAYRPLDRSGGLAGTNSQINCIFVRTHNP